MERRDLGSAGGLGSATLESPAGRIGRTGGRRARTEGRWRRGSVKGLVSEIQARCWAWGPVTTVTSWRLAGPGGFPVLRGHEVSPHVVSEACRAVQPHFTDEKTDLQGHGP